MNADWARMGRWSAWAYGALLLAGGVLVTIVSVGIPPTSPDLAKHYAYVHQVWPELYLSFLLFLAALVCLIAIAIVLHEFFGHSVSSELTYVAFLAAGLVGVLWMLAQIGSAQVVARDSVGMSSADLNVLGTASSLWSGVINWLERGYVVFASVGSYLTGRLVLRQRSLPRGFGWLSLALAIFYWLGLVNLVLFDFGVSLSSEVGSLLVAIGALLAFAWAGWLGWELGRVRA